MYGRGSDVVETTTRDRVWTLILARVRSGNTITVKDVQEKEGCSERVARTALEAAANNADLLDTRHGGHGKVLYQPKVTIEQRDERS